MSSLLLSNCLLVVSMNDDLTEHRGASIVAEDGWITYVGADPPRREYDEVVDCSRRIVIPGLINTHHHLYQTLTRAFAESAGQPLFQWLRTLYPIWAGLDTEMIYASTRAGLAELMLSGCTTCADHLYVFPQGSDDFLDAQIEAAGTLGIRFHPTRGSMDLGRSRGGLPPDEVTQPIDTILLESERVVDRYHDPSRGAMIRIALAPCSPFSVTPELMRQSAEMARRRGVRLHTHISETMDEDRYSREKFGSSPVGLLESLGWLSGDVWVAHCVHPDGHDIDVMARSGVSVAHCPTSNMLLGSGLAPVRPFLDASISVGLGVDGSASNDANDLRQEVKQALLVSRVRDGASAMSAREALRIATRGGAECLGRDDLGGIQPDRVADLVLFDGDDLAIAGGEEDLTAAVVFSAIRPHTVYVHGRAVVRDAHLTRADATVIAREQRTASQRLIAARLR